MRCIVGGLATLSRRLLPGFAVAMATLPLPVEGAGPRVDEFAENGYVSGRVNAVALDTAGRVFLGGSFGAVNGENRGRLARLSADGVLGGPSYYLTGTVFCLAVQPDGKMLLGGAFNAVNGVTHRGLARLNADGSVDETFTPDVNGTVYTLALDAQDRIVAGGELSSVNGTFTGPLFRLDGNGAVDASFEGDQDGRPSAAVRSIGIRPDGGILIAGDFQRVGGIFRDGIALLAPTGRLAGDFYPRVNGPVYGATLYEDGRFVLYGNFRGVNGVFRDGVARLSADGVLDPSFDPNPEGDVVSAAITPDGKIWISGHFVGMALPGGGGIGRRRMARYLPDGTLDATFDPGSEDAVYAIGYQDPDRAVIGGDFTAVGDLPRSRLARLHEEIETTGRLWVRGSRLGWERGPDAAALATPPLLEVLVDGQAPVEVGRLAPAAGQWTMANLSPPNRPYRYRVTARTASGAGNGSSSLVDASTPEYLFRADFDP